MKKAFLVFVLALASYSEAQQLRKYGVQTTVKFTLIDPAGIDLETAASCATGGGAGDDDVQISKSEAAYADSTNCFTNEGNGDYSLVLSATEMQAARITVSIIDDATKVWLDKAIHIETYGHASAMHELDLDDQDFAVSAGKVVRRGTVDDANFTPTTTQFESSDASVAATNAGADVIDNTYRSRALCFTSGALDGNCYTISATDLVVSGRLKFTVTATQQAPADGDEFTIQ